MKTIAIALAAATLLAACAQKKEAPAPAMVAPEPAAPAAMEMPGEGAKPVILSQTVLPDGGTLESATVVTGANGWAVHGVKDGIAWRTGSSDHGYLRVAMSEQTEWQHIQVADSWAVSCKAEAATDGGPTRTFCDVLHTQPVAPNTMTTGGIRVADHGVCAVTDDPNATATLTVDGGAPHALSAPGLCEPGDALASELAAGKSATLNASFAPKSQPVSITFPTAGLKQALALRDWIAEKAKAGELKTE